MFSLVSASVVWLLFFGERARPFFVVVLFAFAILLLNRLQQNFLPLLYLPIVFVFVYPVLFEFKKKVREKRGQLERAL